MFSWEIYEYFRSNHRMCFMKKLFLKISQYSLESCRPASLLETDSNTGVFDQVYSNTRVPTQVNTNQHKSYTNQRVNTNLEQVNTNQHKFKTSQHESDTSQHELTRVKNYPR